MNSITALQRVTQFLTRWAISLIVLFSLLNCVGPTKQSKDRGLYHLQIGTAHLSHKNYPAALSELLRAHDFDPTNPVIENNLALAYFVRDKLVLAEKHFRKAVELEPKYTEARNNLGRVLIEEGLLDPAIVELRTAENDLTYQSPDKTSSNLGLAYFKKGDFKSAKDYLRKSLSYNRDSCTTANYYGRTLLEMSDFVSASQALDRAVTLCKNIDFDEPHFFSAVAYLKLGQKEKAVARFQEVLDSYKDGKYQDKSREMLKQLN